MQDPVALDTNRHYYTLEELARKQELDDRMQADIDRMVNRVTQALRDIPQHDFTPEVAAIIIAGVSSKCSAAYWNDKSRLSQEVIEYLDLAHDTVEYGKG